MNGIQREAMLRHGLTGLLETSGEAEGRGIWSLYDRDEQEKALEYTAFKGSLYTTGTEGLVDFIGAAHTLSYDDQIGSIGGGNHFVEMQHVAEIYDGRTANAWGIQLSAERHGKSAIPVERQPWSRAQAFQRRGDTWK